MLCKDGRLLLHPGVNPVDQGGPQAALGEIKGVLAEFFSFREGVRQIILHPVAHVMINHQFLPFTEKMQKTMPIHQGEEIFMAVPEFKVSENKRAGGEHPLFIYTFRHLME